MEWHKPRTTPIKRMMLLLSSAFWIGEPTRLMCGSLRLAMTNFDLCEVHEGEDAFCIRMDASLVEEFISSQRSP
jgi:hypothetical protein